MVTEKETELKPTGCNMEKWRVGLCGRPAVWAHPRYPTGVFCEEHKEKMQSFLKEGWYLL